MGDQAEVLELPGADEGLAGDVELLCLKGGQGENLPVFGGDAKAGDLEGLLVKAFFEVLHHGLGVGHFEGGDGEDVEVEDVGAVEAYYVALEALAVRREVGNDYGDVAATCSVGLNEN